MGQLPNLHLGLGDIGRKARELRASSQAAGKDVDSKAHYLLAASGIKPGVTKKDIHTFQASSFATSDVRQGHSDWDPDTDKVINQMHQRMSERMMAETMERSRQTFNRFLEENVDVNMERQRQKIMEHFGLVPRVGGDHTLATNHSDFRESGSFGKFSRSKGLGGSLENRSTMLRRSTFGKSSLQKSVIGMPTKSPGKATLFADQAETSTSADAPTVAFSGEKQKNYAEKTRGLNQARLQEASYPLLREYLDVETQHSGEVRLTFRSPVSLSNSLLVTKYPY